MVRVLAIADADSYVKWGAAVLERMPPEWLKSFVLIATPVGPSAEQLAAALAGTSIRPDRVPVLELAELADRAAVEAPDIVLLSLRGPILRVVVRSITKSTARRPVFVTGLPGISIPPTRKALSFRSQTDVVLLHSKREVREFRELAERMGVEQDFGLATLPFLPERREARTGGTDVVFAAQAKVPATLTDRMHVLEWLAQTARAHPEYRVVIKLRAAAGEQQTHAERYPFDRLLEGLADRPANLVVSTGSMAEHLENAAVLVTVSSTAAIEAAALGVPVIALDDFGVSARLINLVFVGSDLLAGSEELIAGRFRRPHPGWLDDNYFHDPAENDWIEAIERALARREAGPFPLRPLYAGRLGGPLRQVWDRKRALGPYDTTISGRLILLVGYPARSVYRVLRRTRRSLRARRAVEDLELEPRRPAG